MEGLWLRGAKGFVLITQLAVSGAKLSEQMLLVDIY